MLAVSLGLLLVGSGVSVHLEELGEMPLQEASALADHLARAIEARTSRRTVLDDPLWPECRDADRCVAAIRARTQTDDVVLLRLYSGPTKIRLIAERLSLDGLRDARIAETVPRSAGDWQLDGLAERLFPEPRAETITERVVTTAPPEAETGFFDVAPWVLIGVGAAALAAGGGFGLSHLRAKKDARRDNADPQEFEAAFDRMRTHGRIANGFFIGGAVGVAAGGVLMMFAE